MKVLVACEFSGIVRDAFLERGHDAISCDLLPTERPGPHIQGDVKPLLREPWNLVIAFPPCSYLSHVNRWFKNDEKAGFAPKFQDAIEFFQHCQNANAPRVCVENPNPMPAVVAIIGPPSDWIEPYHFGSIYRKRTGLWLKNLPILMRTYIRTRGEPYLNLRGGKGLPDRPSTGLGIAQNSHERSRFWPGIAAAMADQWGTLTE